jgi:diguanylate cyclase (GGDEF)-like protein
MATFRRADIVARLGGEEFVALLPSVGTAGAVAVATRLRQAVEARTVSIDGNQIRYTISSGVATMDADVAGLDTLLKRADAAMYEAKRKGRNRVECWAPAATGTSDGEPTQP